MAISTYGVQLMYKESGSSYKKLVDIKSFPDLMGEPNMLETTTLSNKSQTFIPGILQMENLQFLANYTKEDFSASHIPLFFFYPPQLDPLPYAKSHM